jgi:hypothetical protein
MNAGLTAIQSQLTKEFPGGRRMEGRESLLKLAPLFAYETGDAFDPQGLDGWLPMESAPKTGDDLKAKQFLAWCPNQEWDDNPRGGNQYLCWWEPMMKGRAGTTGIWYGDNNTELFPTMWMPLPPDPETTA